jgi:Fe-S oxidoreductase
MNARERMLELAGDVAERCKKCQLCKKECAFLQENGMPGEMAEGLLAGTLDPAVALMCSVCGLCAGVCPVRGLSPQALFQAMREVAVEAEPARARRFRPLLNYETVGLSRPFTFFGVPEGTTRVLFPGCNLPGTRPDIVWNCFLKLREEDPGLGFVLSCCAKPSLMCGLRPRHEERVAGVLGRLARAGVREVLTLCPNCHVTLRRASAEAGSGLVVRTVYEVLAATVREPEGGFAERVRTGVHDPCVLRAERPVHEAVRTLLWNTGSSVAEMRHSMHKALCCGEGGGVGFSRPDLAAAWRARRAEEATERRVVTYCAGCAVSLAGTVDPVHLLDLVLGPEPAPASTWTRGLRTYLNRLGLKRRAGAFLRSKGLVGS